MNAKSTVGLGVVMLIDETIDVVSKLVSALSLEDELASTLKQERDHYERLYQDNTSAAWHDGFNKGYDSALTEE